MLLAATAVIAGFVLLAWSADRFVFGAAATARNLGVSALVVGLTVVGFGTSAPELLISSLAAIDGQPELAVGNALGSNIANVGLVLGLTIMISPLTVRSHILKREFPVMLGAMALAWAVMLDGRLGRLDGAVLILALAALITWTARVGLRERAVGKAADPLGREYEEELAERVPQARALLWLAVGLIVLLASSKLLVWGATELARHFGVSELVIGLTIVAVGTSLPEVATTIASALKREDDIAVGNILGSNMFNALGVLGLPGLIHPAALSGPVLSRDFPAMFAMAVALLLMAYRRGGVAHIHRFEGVVLLAGYAAYLALLTPALFS
jgi:cation:H+ antiporter